jgi:hypothetical protein
MPGWVKDIESYAQSIFHPDKILELLEFLKQKNRGSDMKTRLIKLKRTCSILTPYLQNKVSSNFGQRG